MAWPSAVHYSEAVQNPKTAFWDSELQQGRPQVDKLGLPHARSGSFAVVFKILCQTRNWAAKCFLGPVSDQQQRYAEISAYLERVRIPYLVQFSYLANGIRIAGQAYPLLRMEWVEGEPLITFVERNLANPDALLRLAGRWVEMMGALRRSSVAHGDLQHGNVIVVNGEIRLVDYDGMFVPGLAGKLGPELGQRNYQHPGRTEFDYGPDMDNFSSWVIYISLIALAVQPELWSQFKGGDDCLLLRKSDFDAPESSAFFRSLESARDARLRSAVTFFHSLLYLESREVPALDGKSIPSVGRSRSAQVGQIGSRTTLAKRAQRASLKSHPPAIQILLRHGYWILFRLSVRRLIKVHLEIQSLTSASLWPFQFA